MPEQATGYFTLSNSRVFAARREIAARQASAVRASAEATDDRERAMLRGKVHAYGEALCLLAALDRGTRITHLLHATAPKPRGHKRWAGWLSKRGTT